MRLKFGGMDRCAHLGTRARGNRCPCLRSAASVGGVFHYKPSNGRDVGCWHKADVIARRLNVRFWCKGVNQIDE